MSKYPDLSPERYAVATTKWRQQFDQYGTLQGEVQLDAAESWIYKLSKSDSSMYEQFMSDAKAWAARATRQESPAPVNTTNAFQLGIARPLDTGTSRCAEVQAPNGSTYYVEFAVNIKNLGTPKMPENQPVIFIPHEKYYDPSSGERRDPWATDVYLVPCEVDSRMDNQRIEGLKKISVIIVLGARSTPAHIYDATYVAAKLKFLVLGSTRVSDVLEQVSKKFKTEGTFGARYSSVSYDQIAPESTNPLRIEKTGRYYSQVGLPWLQIGASGHSNPGIELNVNGTIDENNVKEDGIIFCNSYKRGNGLTSYGGAGKTDIEWYDVLLEIVS